MNEIKNIDSNVVKIGKTQSKEFNLVKTQLNRIENTQVILNANIEILDSKIQALITLLNKKPV